MQITIVQAEIEAAILAYIQDQFTIRDGMNVAVELTATRGAEGFKATIDISRLAVVKDTPKAVSTVVSVEMASKPPFGGLTQAPVSAVSTVSIPMPAVSLNSVTASGVVPSSPAEVRAMMENEPEAANDTVATAVSAVADAPATEEAPVRPTSSLFKGLKRPVNA